MLHVVPIFNQHFVLHVRELVEPLTEWVEMIPAVDFNNQICLGYIEISLVHCSYLHFFIEIAFSHYSPQGFSNQNVLLAYRLVNLFVRMHLLKYISSVGLIVCVIADVMDVSHVSETLSDATDFVKVDFKEVLFSLQFLLNYSN